MTADTNSVTAIKIIPTELLPSDIDIGISLIIANQAEVYLILIGQILSLFLGLVS